MLNPYSVRPIGSEKFLEHLKDVQTRKYYNLIFPVEIKLNVHGSAPWTEKDAFDPYRSLAIAILASAILDYLEMYENKEHYFEEDDEPRYWIWNSKCISLENEYFRNDPELEKLFDRILEDICWNGKESIRQCKERLKRVLRWSQTQRGGKD